MMAFLGALIAGLSGGIFSGSVGGAGNAALGGAQAASEATFAANQAELIASDTKLNTMAVKDAETTNTQEYSVAVDEAHNHVVRSYIEAVKQVQ
jgi:hypothetical protein